MNTKVHFTSESDNWATPDDFYQKCNARFGPFTLDVCASSDNAKCSSFFTVSDDGLSKDWGAQVCWMNPPYGRTIREWMRKAYESSLNGATVVCLVPARTDTQWWHAYALKGDVEFIKGRLKFGGHKHSAPFPSALVIFKPSI